MLPKVYKDTMIVKTGNRELVNKIFEVALYDHHMDTMIEIWYGMHTDKELGPWLLQELENYLLEADHNVWTC